MNKDELQVGDLVIKVPICIGQRPAEHYGIGLAVYTSRLYNPPASVRIRGVPLKIYWFKLGYVLDHWSTSLVKLSPTQEEENE